MTERIFKIKEEDDRPQFGAWAPGDYYNECIYCEEQFIGDKRAVSCADCAYLNLGSKDGDTE